LIVKGNHRPIGRQTLTIFISTKKGFTFIEVLLALAITGIITLAVYSTYFTALKTGEKWAQREGRFYLARNVLERMQREISSLYYNPRIEKEDNFAGEERDLTFYTTAPSLYFPYYGLTKIKYEFIITEEKKGVLKRTEEPALNFELEENKHVKTWVWSEELKDLRFQYSDGNDWFATWNLEKPEKYLQVIKVVLTFPDGETFSTLFRVGGGEDVQIPEKK